MQRSTELVTKQQTQEVLGSEALTSLIAGMLQVGVSCCSCCLQVPTMPSTASKCSSKQQHLPLLYSTVTNVQCSSSETSMTLSWESVRWDNVLTSLGGNRLFLWEGERGKPGDTTSMHVHLP